MKKIITAICNPKLNEELNKNNNFEIIGKDLQYREAILEILEKNKKIDLIIINENLLGDISFENLFEKINLINEKIKIIFILEKENKDLEKILKKNNINDIFYNNKINLNELIKIINKKEINIEKEKNTNQKETRNKEDKIIQKKEILEKKILRKKSLPRRAKNKKTVNKTDIMSKKLITFSGNAKSGKTTLALIISQYLSERKYKVLLVDGDFEKHDLSIILKSDLKIQNTTNNFFVRNFEKNKRKNFNFPEEKINKEIINNKLKNENKKDEFIIVNKKNKNKKWNYKFNNLKNKIKNNKLKIKKEKNKNKINKLKIINNKNKKIKIYNLKNKINIRKINNKINLFTQKINNNFYFFSELNQITKNCKKEIQKTKVCIFLQLLTHKYDFIIFELSKYNFGIVNEEISKKSNKNFLITESNLLGIKEIQRLVKNYTEKWKIDGKSLHIIENKYNSGYINQEIASKVLSMQNEIFVIREDKKYNFFIESFLKRKILLKNKKIKKD